MPTRRTQLLGGLVALSLIALAGGAWYATAEVPVAPAGPYRDPSTGYPGIGPDQALQRWAEFPVRVNPRPLVIYEERVKQPEFRTTETGRAARAGFRAKSFTIDARLPTAPVRVQGWRVVSAENALQQLGRTVAPLPTGSDPPEPSSTASGTAVITAVRLTSEYRFTDRGLLPVPVWSIAFRGARTPATVLAVAPGDVFTSPVREDAVGSWVQISADGRTLTYEFMAGPAGDGPCESEFDPLVRESGQAVAIGAHRRPGKARRLATYACDLAGHVRRVTAQLAAPLGNRPVVTWSHGAPLMASTKSRQEMYQEAARAGAFGPALARRRR